ncbi:MAG: asparagine synthase (glutamine-hydrolyzing), partial [Desulfobacterales bacterium]|nr:asparagine synthase (glutamine-hydrolyzing) [Desulfobacterales bacterium]
GLIPGNIYEIKATRNEFDLYGTAIMCGICGKFDVQAGGISRDLLEKMCRSFAYRGPDDEGVYVAPPIGLGHRRLSIIDLSPAGHQPMSNEDESIWLVFNGEIYDFQALREHLLAKGHTLRSQTDSEIIIHLYEEEGISCLKHLNGMFAFALWDASRQRLWLVRDRLGIKPLVYYWDGRRLLFASEIKAILCDPHVAREIDPEALDLYLTLNFIPGPWTIFKNIRKLLPGHSLVLEGGNLSIEPYWDIPGKQDSPGEAGEFPDEGDPKARRVELLEASVKRRLIADVPLGAFLSGGIDSSIIVALMARNSSRRVKTFSIGYRDLPSFDETAYAREVAEFNQTDHHEFKLGYRDILEAFPKVLENVDEPFADSSAVPTYIVSRETRNHVTVALSGDGGDELFAGYRMYMGEYWSGYYNRIPGFIRNGLISPLVQALPDARDKPSLEKIRRVKKFLRGVSLSFEDRFCAWREVFPFPLRQALLKAPPGRNLYQGFIQDAVGRHRGTFGEDTINLMLYLDAKGLLPGDMLTKVDRMSMVNALEVRVPFLDYTLVEYVF